MESGRGDRGVYGVRLRAVILLTGATGTVGSRVLDRLVARRDPVRCLVRDPRRLGPDRVRVQITLGDLADTAWLRPGLRGVRTVIHLAATARDQPRASIEEIDGLATWRLLRAAEAAGVEHVVFLSALGATPGHEARVMRAKALAEDAVAGAALRTTTLRSSLICAPQEARRLGVGRGESQPIRADDVADCVVAAAVKGSAGDHAVLELAGPERFASGAFGEGAPHGRSLLRRVPLSALRAPLRAYETLAGPAAAVTWDEVAFRATAKTTPSGTRDAEALGVVPRPVVAADSTGP